jgi:voltage-gated potassium channel Kch
MAHVTELLVKQRRFKLLLLTLVLIAVLIGLLIVPVEVRYPGALITNLFDGIWWSTQTVTSVGYGDIYPVSKTGKILGMILELVGVLAFGLLVSMVTVTLEETKEKYYRHKLNERLDRLEQMLDKIEKQEQFVVKNQVENGPPDIREQAGS